MKKAIIYFFLAFLLFLPGKVRARTSEITDWYIKDFVSEINLTEDGRALITEKIVADCGNLPDKHGIFRVLPTKYTRVDGKTVKTPIQLESITDFGGNKIPFETSSGPDTVTWKIGDKNKTVSGLNDYKISYSVKNTIYFGDQADEFFWNLSGNFWQIEIDEFKAFVNLPADVSSNKIQATLLSGSLGLNSNTLAAMEWSSDKQMVVKSIQKISVGQGISLKAVFPKGIFTQPEKTFMEKYALALALISIFVFSLMLLENRKFKRTVKTNGSI